MRAPDSEECDDGNLEDGDGCSSTCSLAGSVTCGDGKFEGAEECDLGSSEADDGDENGCEADCTVELTYDYIGEPSTCSQSCVEPYWYEGLPGDTHKSFDCGTFQSSHATPVRAPLGKEV